MTPGPASRKCTAYLLAGPGGMPLELGLNEGLGVTRAATCAVLQVLRTRMARCVCSFAYSQG